MSLKENATEEFNRSPITVASTVLSLLVAVASFVVATARPESVRSFEPPEAQAITFSASNLLLVISFFAALSVASASVTRLLARKHEFGAFFLSVVLAAATAFSTYVVFNFVPPTSQSQENLSMAANLIYWSTLIVFVGFCGQPILVKLVIMAVRIRGDNSYSPNEMIRKERDRIWGTLLIGTIILAAWGSMVSYGQNALTKTLLPSSWQPPSKPLKIQSTARKITEIMLG